MFSELDTEEDGNVYLKEVIVTLKALNHDLDHNLRVRILVWLLKKQRLYQGQELSWWVGHGQQDRHPGGVQGVDGGSGGGWLEETET